MKRLSATLISCFVLLCTTMSVPALAEVKDNAQQLDTSALQDALTSATDGIQSVLDGAKANLLGLLNSSNLLSPEGNEVAQMPANASSQEVDGIGTDSSALSNVVPSSIPGVVWNADYTTCTIQAGTSVGGVSLRIEISTHDDTLTTFIAEDNTSLTGNATSLFFDCSSLSTVSLAASFDTSAVTNMNSMFASCSALSSLTLPAAFDTSKVTDMSGMFEGCTQLETVDISKFSSEKLTSCIGMFANCDNLKELNLGNFVPPAGQASLAMFADVDMETGDISGSIPSIEKITMSGSCILEPGEGTTASDATGTFFDYKEPLSWSAYYLGNDAGGQLSAQSAQNDLSAEPDAVLTGFDEFKSYQETHPGFTTYIFDEQPVPPGPTPGPTPEPTPTPTPSTDVTPASDATELPLTGDTFAGLSWMVLAAIAGALALSTGWILHRKREL